MDMYISGSHLHNDQFEIDSNLILHRKNDEKDCEIIFNQCKSVFQ